MAEEYLCSGALLRCNKGASVSTLTAVSTASVQIQGHTVAVHTDAVPITNIVSFGACLITKMPCVPATIRWSGYQQNVRYGGGHALTDQSYCRCTVGGKITVQHSGQYGPNKVVTEGKVGRYKARMAIIDQAKTKLQQEKRPVLVDSFGRPIQTPGLPPAALAAARLSDYNRVVERARLSDHIYKVGPNGKPTVPPPPGWRLLSDAEAKRRFGVEPYYLRNNESGYKAGIYESDFEQPKKIIIAYAGTEDEPDAITDAAQAFGDQTDQYDRAMKLSTAVTKKAGASNVETTGHSLGGGLASAGAAVTGAKGVTLNPAGLHKDTPLRQNGVSVDDVADRRQNVQVYRSAADPLNNLQNNPKKTKAVVNWLIPDITILTKPGRDLDRRVNDPNTLPPAYGVQHEVQPSPEYVHRWSELLSRNPIDAAAKMALDGHGIGQMIEHLEYYKEQDLATLEAYLRT